MSVKIDAPPEMVWGYLVDWENLDQWMLEGKGFKVTSAHREGLGVTAEATISIAGITTTDPVEVTRWEPPEALEISHQGWVAGKGPDGVQAGALGDVPVLEGDPLPAARDLPGAIGLRFFKPIMRKVFERDLQAAEESGRKSTGRGRAIGFHHCGQPDNETSALHPVAVAGLPAVRPVR